MSWHQHHQQQQPSHVQCSPCSLSSTSPPQPPTISSPSCSSSSSSSYSSRQSPPISQKGPPIVRRRRGRPPNATRHPRDNNWTFVTPTVWEVRRSPSPILPSSQPTATATCIDSSSSREHSPTSQHDITVLQWPDDPYGRNNNNTASSEAFNSTFSSTNMDTPLSMPRKKRGRKPKMQLAGNSCFVWRDLTAKKRTHRIKKPHKDDDRLALRVEGLKL
ncbi:hypothetical protein K492DRAFT_173065 [Lichtheimia hyalospora FSU 10163]|nr:hypothetical protein K492DRAFT_173065 [Lichtheimia hyalospora FSU 10163]